MHRSLLAPVLGVVLLLPAPIRADRLVIAPSSTSEPKLLLPPELLAKRRSTSPAPQEMPGIGPSLPTIMAGLALATAAVLAGMIVARRSSPRLLTGVAAAYAYSIISVIRGAGAVYLEVGCVILMFVTLGRWLEATGRLRASAALERLQKLVPETVRVRRNGGFVRLPTRDVVRGEAV